MSAGVGPAADLAAPRDFRDLYEQQSRKVISALILAGSSREDAEDATQEAFARTLVHWRRVQQGSSPAGYVFRTAFRLARRRRPLIDPPERERLVAAEAENVTNTIAVRAALARLPPRQRQCLILKFYLDWSTSDAAAALHLRESTVRTHLEKGAASLARHLSS